MNSDAVLGVLGQLEEAFADKPLHFRHVFFVVVGGGGGGSGGVVDIVNVIVVGNVGFSFVVEVVCELYFTVIFVVDFIDVDMTSAQTTFSSGSVKRVFGVSTVDGDRHTLFGFYRRVLQLVVFVPQVHHQWFHHRCVPERLSVVAPLGTRVHRLSHSVAEFPVVLNE